jgi:hypothetical protein
MTIDGNGVSRCANVTIISAEYSLALAGTVHSAVYRASANTISIHLAAAENFCANSCRTCLRRDLYSIRLKMEVILLHRADTLAGEISRISMRSGIVYRYRAGLLFHP